MVICRIFPGNGFLSAPAVGLPRRTWSGISTATSGSRTSGSRWAARSTASSARPRAGGWTPRRVTSATSAVVLATGRYRTPTIPPWPGLSEFVGEVVHSVDFRNAWPFRDRNILVVGAGNSAADIAVQLADNGAGKVWLAVRTPPHLVRRAIGPIPSDIFLELFARVPARIVDPVIARLNRLLLGDVSVYGFGRPPLGLKATVEQRGRIPTLADELVNVVRARRIDVVAAVTALESEAGDPGRRHRHHARRDHCRDRLRRRSGRPDRPSRRARRTRQSARRLRLGHGRWDVRDRLRHPTQRPVAGDPAGGHTISRSDRGLPTGTAKGDQWRYSPQSGSSTAV